ncbi:MAG: thioredoxin domain-containing protein [Polyangiaceae bacterium]|nr:thioredoxin domain-containing protein [Polyangiaceae bacterium]
MRPTLSFALAAWSAGCVLLGCSLGLSPRPETNDTASGPRTAQADSSIPKSATPVRALPGVDTSDLPEERKQAFWDVANRLYAPCTDQAVTLAKCVEDKRACDACLPAANLLAAQVRRGSSKAQAASAVNARFSPDAVRSVDPAGSPAKGPDNAPVTIVVFSDFQCPACKATLPVLDEALQNHPGDVRLVHKFYPLEKHTRAKPAAYAAAAAMKQGKYWEMERVLFANQEALSDQDLFGYAEKIGLDMVKFKEDYASNAVHEMVDRDVAAGEKAGVSHTPFILLNGRLFDTTYFKYDRDLDSWIETEAALAKKKQASAPAAAPAPAPAPAR